MLFMTSNTQMKKKDIQCGVTMSPKERELLLATANYLDVPYSLVMRRLIKYILDGKIEWTELFRMSNALEFNDEPDNAGSVYFRTQLSLDMSIAFAQLADDWGSTTSVILRRLVQLYVTGKIERHAIWY
jgi:hypothetical protein